MHNSRIKKFFERKNTKKLEINTNLTFFLSKKGNLEHICVNFKQLYHSTSRTVIIEQRFKSFSSNGWTVSP